MDYKIIKNKADIDELMSEFDSFHDSCIKEISYESGSYVDKDRAMYPFDDKRGLTIVFQSQGAAFRTVELKFEGLIRLNLLPRKENYDSIIFEASLIEQNGVYYWSEWGNFNLNEENDSFGTWLAAKKVSWCYMQID